jgi:hypothetical protein
MLVMSFTVYHNRANRSSRISLQSSFFSFQLLEMTDRPRKPEEPTALANIYRHGKLSSLHLTESIEDINWSRLTIAVRVN